MKNVFIILIIVLVSACKKSVVENNCCLEAPVYFTENNVVVYVPNIFTPNGDGSNDRFGPEANFGLTSYDLKVVDTKKTIWEGTGSINTSIDAGFWDGRFEGNKQEGIFGWELTIITFNEDTLDFRGQVCCLPNPENFCIANENGCFTASQFQNGTLNENFDKGDIFCLE